MIWIRITKSGGESMNGFLRAAAKENFLSSDVLICTPCIHNPQYLFFKKHYYEQNDKNVFSIIRNPYEKAVSSWKWLTKNPKGMERCEGIFKKRTSFTKFLEQSQELRSNFDKVRNICVTLSNDAHEWKTQEYKEYWVVSHMESSFDSLNFFLDPRKVELVPLGKSAEFAKSCVKRGLSFGYPKLNSSPATKRLNKKERALVEKIYEKDFELWEAAQKW